MPEIHQPFDANLGFIVLDSEEVTRFHELLEDARHDYAPRNFGERHLVEELALSKWRKLRVLIFKRAIYARQQREYNPPPPEQPEHPDDYLDEFFHTAMAHTRDLYGDALEALQRLEYRYHRQLCEALRLLDTLQSRPAKKENGKEGNENA